MNICVAVPVAGMWKLVIAQSKEIPIMKQNKNTFRIIVAALVAIWGFAIFSCTNNKKKDEAASTTIASTKAANDTFRVRPLTNIKYEELLKG